MSIAENSRWPLLGASPGKRQGVSEDHLLLLPYELHCPLQWKWGDISLWSNVYYYCVLSSLQKYASLSSQTHKNPGINDFAEINADFFKVAKNSEKST